MPNPIKRELRMTPGIKRATNILLALLALNFVAFIWMSAANGASSFPGATRGPGPFDLQEHVRIVTLPSVIWWVGYCQGSLTFLSLAALFSTVAFGFLTGRIRQGTSSRQ